MPFIPLSQLSEEEKKKYFSNENKIKATPSSSGQEAVQEMKSSESPFDAYGKQAGQFAGNVAGALGNFGQAINPFSSESLQDRAGRVGQGALQAGSAVAQGATFPLAPVVQNTMAVAQPSLEKAQEGLQQVGQGFGKLGEDAMRGFKGDPGQNELGAYREADRAMKDVLYGGMKATAGAVGAVFSPIGAAVGLLPEEAQTPFKLFGETFQGTKDFVTGVFGITGTEEGNLMGDMVDVYASLFAPKGAGKVKAKITRIGSKVETELSLLQKPILEMYKVSTDSAGIDTFAMRATKVADEATAQQLYQSKEIFGNTARTITTSYLPKVQVASRNIIESFSEGVIKRGLQDVDSAPYVSEITALRSGFYKSIAESMNIPVVQGQTRQVLTGIDIGVSHLGNQTPEMMEVVKTINQVKNNSTLATMVTAYDKIHEFLADPALSSQSDFLNSFKTALQKDIDASVSVVSTDAGNMLRTLDAIGENIKSTVTASIEEATQAKVAKGVDAGEALIDSIPKNVKVSDLPVELVQEIQRTVVKNLTTEMKSTGKLNVQSVYNKISETLQRPELLTNETVYQLTKIQTFLKHSKDMWSDMSESWKVARASKEKLAQEARMNPSMENIERLSRKTGGELTPQDISSVILQKNMGLGDDLARQQDIAKSNVGANMSDVRPEVVTGKLATDMAERVLQEKRSSGATKGSLITKNADKKVDITPAKQAVMDLLAQKKITTKNGNPDFKNSVFRDDPATQKFVVEMLQDFKKKTVTVGDLDTIRQRIRANKDTSKDIRGNSPEFVTTLSDKARSALSSAIDEAVPGYKEANTRFAKATEALNKFFKKIGIEKNVDELSEKDLRSGEILQRLSGNASAHTLDAIKDIIDVFDEVTGENILPKIKQLVGNKDLLNKLYGDVQSGNLKNQIDIPTSKSGAVNKIIESGVGLGKKVLGMEDVSGKSALEVLLRETKPK